MMSIEMTWLSKLIDRLCSTSMEASSLLDEAIDPLSEAGYIFESLEHNWLEGETPQDALEYVQAAKQQWEGLYRMVQQSLQAFDLLEEGLQKAARKNSWW